MRKIILVDITISPVSSLAHQTEETQFARCFSPTSIWDTTESINQRVAEGGEGVLLAAGCHLILISNMGRCQIIFNYLQEDQQGIYAGSAP